MIECTVAWIKDKSTSRYRTLWNCTKNIGTRTWELAVFKYTYDFLGFTVIVQEYKMKYELHLFGLNFGLYSYRRSGYGN